MAENKKEIEKCYEVYYICDNCGSDQVLPTGVCLMSSPPQYPHICKKCSTTYVFRNIRYPYIKYETAK